MNCPELDPLFKLKIGHDNSGHGGSWHLDYVSQTELLLSCTVPFLH